MTTTTCAECGAVWADEQTCQAVFDAFLIQDFTDPGYGAVHFLTVSTFMLQHGRYSDEALAWVVPTMRAYLAGDTDVARIRQASGPRLAQGQRTWKVVRAPTAPRQHAVAWDITLADVAAQVHDAASYRAAITAWAARVVAQWPSQPAALD